MESKVGFVLFRSPELPVRRLCYGYGYGYGVHNRDHNGDRNGDHNRDHNHNRDHLTTPVPNFSLCFFLAPK